LLDGLGISALDLALVNGYEEIVNLIVDHSEKANRELEVTLLKAPNDAQNQSESVEDDEGVKTEPTESQNIIAKPGTYALTWMSL
jgi:hypothetical protein